MASAELCCLKKVPTIESFDFDDDAEPTSRDSWVFIFCGGGGHVTIVEATEVEEFDGEEDPDEWVPTVQARLVGGPRGGGKRKR